MADAEEGKLICVIGDTDTVTGFLLAGVGQRDKHGANFLVVDASACTGGGVWAGGSGGVAAA